jgi:ABC-type branched-subunit amino acid transport system ATPase component
VSADPLLAVADLSKAFGGLRAVIDVSFEVAEGQIFGLIGPNGSGKTTVLNLISGALRPDGGWVRFAGRDLDAHPASARTRLGIARTFQLVRPLSALSSLDNVLVARLYARDRPAQAAAREESLSLLDLLGLRAKAHAPAGALTLTERKRLDIARALATRPRILLLDEPLGGLNPTEVQGALALFTGLRERGVTLVIVEHNVPAVRALCERIVVLNTGRVIAEGPPEDVLARRGVIEVYLGTDLRRPVPNRSAPAATS